MAAVAISVGPSAAASARPFPRPPARRAMTGAAVVVAFKAMADWDCQRGGLHTLSVDGNVVARVERGAESRDRWYWTAWICKEPQGGPPCETMLDAMAAAEKALSGA